ncbi:hypothetical protein GGS23DRAFT_56489 [Durotheca rogersii]|uniref:uncharacterized protein n=1 Tax=Durotheca rogersii TaxID=419775 RepID=UPI00221E90FF|nr:uncharacterized protein GGS23DRAFT_56489 [Durotheca rogersii]KAI5863168.1 hypothetical protein GGS23DRAFT_56489 [Durotheca rogersii]
MTNTARYHYWPLHPLSVLATARGGLSRLSPRLHEGDRRLPTMCGHGRRRQGSVRKLLLWQRSTRHLLSEAGGGERPPSSSSLSLPGRVLTCPPSHLVARPHLYLETTSIPPRSHPPWWVTGVENTMTCCRLFGAPEGRDTCASKWLMLMWASDKYLHHLYSANGERKTMISSNPTRTPPSAVAEAFHRVPLLFLGRKIEKPLRRELDDWHFSQDNYEDP